MLSIFGLTDRGKAYARSIHHEDTPEWRVIHYLDKVQRSSPEQIGVYCSMGIGQTKAVLRKLKSRGIVAEETDGV